MISLLSTRDWVGGHIKTIIVEECSLMFSGLNGYKTNDVLKCFPRTKRILMTTATTYTLATVKNREAPNAVIVLDHTSFSEGLKLYYTIVDNEEQKLSALCDVIDYFDVEKGIVFCRNSDTVNSLFEKLRDIYPNFPWFSIVSIFFEICLLFG